MATGESPPKSLEDLAANQLGLKNRGSSAEALAAIFGKLHDDDFLPDPMSHEAILTLRGRPVGAESMLAWQLAEAHEQRLHDDIERFAAEFFSIAVAARVERWNALIKLSGRDNRRIERLRALQPGLTIDAQAALAAATLERPLVEDLLAIFPLPPSSRAVESRIRAERHLANPAFKETDRARALKLLKRRRPDVAALSESFLDKLSKPRRPIRVKPARTWAPDESPAVDVSKSRALAAIAVIFVAAFSRMLLNKSVPSPTRPTLPLSRPVFPQNQSFGPGPAPSRKATSLILRNELKARIRGELDQLDLFLDEPKLDRVVARLPVEIVPDAGGMATLRLLGVWTDEIQSRFAVSLKDGLRETDLDLTEPELDELVARCLPKRQPQPGPP